MESRGGKQPKRKAVSQAYKYAKHLQKFPIGRSEQSLLCKKQTLRQYARWCLVSPVKLIDRRILELLDEEVHLHRRHWCLRACCQGAYTIM